MTLKTKSYLPINTRGSKLAKCLPHNVFAHRYLSSSNNTPSRNNGGWFPSSSKLSSKRSLRHDQHVSFINFKIHCNNIIQNIIT